MAWQPIETAPKDGTRFLAFTTTRGDFELTQYLRDVDDPEAETGLDRVQVIFWDEDALWWQLEIIGSPTHWMPIPAPPSPTP